MTSIKDRIRTVVITQGFLMNAVLLPRLGVVIPHPQPEGALQPLQ